MLEGDFSPNPEDLQQAAQQTLERRKQMQAQQSESDKGKLAQGAGIVGALLSTFMTGNPLPGYAVGQQIGGLATGRKGAGIPGMDQLQAVIGYKKKPEEAAGAGLLGPATMRLGQNAPAAENPMLAADLFGPATKALGGGG